MRPRAKSRAKPQEKNIVFLSEFYNDGDILFLYDGHERKHHPFQSFIGHGLKNNEFCAYAFPHKSDKVRIGRYFGDHVNMLRQFPIVDRTVRVNTMYEEDISQLNGKIGELSDHVASNGHDALRLQMDFGSLVNSKNVDAVIDFETDIKRNASAHVPTMTAFNVDSLDQESVEKLVKLHERVVISTNDEKCISYSRLPKDKDPFGQIPNIDAISSEGLEQCVKKSLTVIVLSLLQQRPMSGFDIIKTIIQNFGVFLSQGTVYPLLYSLKEQGYLEIEVQSDNKTRLYTPTDTGKMFIKDKIKGYITAQERILYSIVDK